MRSKTRVLFVVAVLVPCVCLYSVEAQMVVGGLGVQMQPCLPRGCGLLITDIVPDSAADYAGLLPGDTIVQLNGKNVYDDMIGVKNYIQNSPGTIAELTISRDGFLQTGYVRLDAIPINDHPRPMPSMPRPSPPVPAPPVYPPASQGVTVIHNYFGNIDQRNISNQSGTGHSSNQNNQR